MDIMEIRDLTREDLLDQVEEAYTSEASIAVAVMKKEEGVIIISDATASELLQAIHALASADPDKVLEVCNCGVCKESIVVIEGIKTVLQNRYEIKH